MVVTVATATAPAPLAAFDVGPGSVPAEAAVQPQNDDDPEANLPFLFAVYIITWGQFNDNPRKNRQDPEGQET